jgi:FkbM family methyltransferase
MKRLKQNLKALIGLNNSKDVDPLDNLIYIGSQPHGYWVPAEFLNENSVCYCVGAGDDISFDTELKRLYNSKIYIFDPTPASKKHFTDLKEISRKNQAMPALSQDSTFRYKVNARQLEEMHFIEKGVWSEKTVLKFYDPGVDYYVSHSVYLFKNSENFIELPVDSIKNFMKEFGHHSIDLLKLEIEGAEYEVIDSIVKDEVDVKILMVEFDEVYHTKGVGHFFRIKKASKQLMDAGYVLVHSTEKLKRTFIRKDVYRKLRQAEKTSKEVY